ncbi:MAG: DNA-binding protein [Burkholderiaceae bacterium]
MTETQIATDIERLRAEVPDTRSLYREVCALLFFRYGITPTANRLYQYVRKGSMNVPAEVLSTFWDQLRERSRVRIDHPALPESLKTQTAELLSALWDEASRRAAETLAVQREAVDAELNAARRAQEASQRRCEELATRLKEATDTLHNLRRELGNAERDAARAVGEANALRVQLALAKRRSSRKPLGGVPEEPASGQEALGLDDTDL